MKMELTEEVEMLDDPQPSGDILRGYDKIIKVKMSKLICRHYTLLIIIMQILLMTN